MTSKERTTQAAVQSRGAVFHRCALQVNPHHYAGKFRGQETDGNPEYYAKAMVEKAVDLGISVLAITDHNSVSEVALFQNAAKGQEITIFPGFELSSSEGVHVLCIYPPDTAEGQLQLFLGMFGIQSPVPSSDPSKRSFVDILTQTREQGGIAIAAHVTNKSGLFKVLSGQPRINAWRSEDLLAIQIPGAVDDLPQDIREIVRNKNPHYLRTSSGGNVSVATVNAKDVARPEDLAEQAATCLIKMSEVSVEGLRQAFLDPGSRIRLVSDPVPTDHAELLSLSWQGGFLDGAALRFNPSLNVLVGGRGTGKSTVIESLRYALDLTPFGDAAREAHQGIVNQVLMSGTKIVLHVRSHHPTQQEYRIERTIPNPPIVRGEDGALSKLAPEEILRHVEVYGQHEISELTRSQEKLTRLLGRFVEPNTSFGLRKAGLRHGLEKSRRSILDVRAELKEVEERLADLPGLEETLERFRKAGLEDRLREQSILVKEEGVLKAIPEHLATFHECLSLLQQELPIDRAFLSEKALQGLPGKEILSKSNAVLELLSTSLQEVTRQLEVALQQAENELSEIRDQWSRRKDTVQDNYQKILRELRQAAVDGEAFIRLRQEIEGLRPLKQRRALLSQAHEQHWSHRKKLLEEWREVNSKEFRNLDRAAKKVSGKLRDQVNVTVTAAGNREPLFKLLRDRVGGQLGKTIEKLEAYRELSLEDFANACRQGVEELREKYHLTPAQAHNIANADQEVFMRIEEVELPSTTIIQLNTALAGEPPQWQALEDLSTGQKATAVLLLLLLESDAPLIVDQPEDDLDNRFITESIVPKMRDEKRRRQFVFSTHNANIPVLGDAEMIIGLVASGGAEMGRAGVAPEHVGAIDARPVRELIEEVLEGGKEAFERRRRKYGF